MRFEIDYKPNKLIIQRKTKAGTWCQINEIEAKVPFTPEAVYDIVVYLANSYDADIRILSGKGNQLITSRGIDFNRVTSVTPASFYKNLNLAKLVTASKENGQISVFGRNNKYMPSIDTIWDFLANHGGLKAYHPYAVTPEDGYIWCGKVTCEDGTVFTIAFYF